MRPDFRARAKQTAVAWASLGADELRAREQAADADVRAARVRVEHDLRNLVVEMFKSGRQARHPQVLTDDPPALFAAGGRFFR